MEDLHVRQKSKWLYGKQLKMQALDFPRVDSKCLGDGLILNIYYGISIVFH